MVFVPGMLSVPFTVILLQIAFGSPKVVDKFTVKPEGITTSFVLVGTQNGVQFASTDHILDVLPSNVLV